MYEQMANMTDDIQRRCSLPSLKSSTSDMGSGLGDDRRLPPLPRMEPLPRGPFNPFHAKEAFGPTTPGPHDTFQFKSSWSGGEQIVAPPSPANSAESSWQESFTAQKAVSSDWPNDLSQTEIMALIAPQNINRKAPLQQLCGRKRKSSTDGSDPDDQREKHRIAEGNRRKNLSQLHRELDGRIHDFFLERAGWNPSKSLPQSKEHIVQGAVYLIDFMLAIIMHLIRQEQVTPQLSEKLQPQVRCMQLQQLVTSLQQQNQTAQSQLRAAKAENELLADRNRALEFQLKSYEQMFRSPKPEINSPRPLIDVPEHKRQKKALPGMRVFCDEINATMAPQTPVHHESLHSATSQTFSSSYLTTTPPITGPSSPAFPTSQSSFTFPASRRQSLIPSP
ncbi:hypothetical protein N7448_001037 [Penicillium atrosanguineum]|uniref:HLH DNA binding domain protein n=1 Tax=Penicillium atrosanguineum TaxID=1132637 RepID=A0A9W9Q6M7_9EURO|nr:Phosphoribulokinase/uridine kinase [Penicillium atrosanguineum]KAJ5133942.1 hypothetical protein N7526_005307 [Penicillium atrosanguineum]KAJ5149459.1 hypothetical protein N7448_001037 [Penicillium atrosanguineum]KAJ5304774.1 Phosphoribulokinase/uridine kinase [Penicillium atrosanguineum]KAJ5324237.1 hypothetical protein N7476_002837 [Penicillium atrosanguineum]